jgi:hypothetical protein
MQRYLLFFVFTLLSIIASAQGEDASTAITLTNLSANFTCVQNYSSTSCLATSTTQNLGVTTSSQTPAFGTMANDVWFSFAAAAEVLKIRVCNPTFDAAFEVWNSAGTTMIASVNSNANTGASGKEVSCVSGLTFGTNYKVRVGRVSGTGAGTFQFNIEHSAVEVRNGYYPSPTGTSCYHPGLSIKRTNTCVVAGVIATRWKFVPVNGDPPIICIGVTDQLLSNCPGICMNGDYIVYCEVQTNDAECGTIWWGYSLGRTIIMCDGACPNILTPANNSVICNFLTTQYTCNSLGAGFKYQWRFITDNGATILCSTWSNQTVFLPNNSSIQDCFRFGKIYQVQVRARFCDSEPEGEWCPPGITVLTCAAPLVNFQSGQCCRYKNKAGFIYGTNVIEYDQYRFRFTKVDLCSTASPIQPIAPAFTTTWLSSPIINPNGIAEITAGSTYMIQLQGRINQTTSSCQSCTNGSILNVPSQQADWGPPCFITFRTSSSPPVGTVLPCYCTAGMPTAEDQMPEIEELRYTEGATQTVGVLTASTQAQRMVAMDLSKAQMTGDGMLIIYNINGQKVYEQALYNLEENYYFSLNMSDSIEAGVYIISVTSSNGMVTDKIFFSGQ